MTLEEERAYRTDVVETIERATGRRPKGWLGPALTETPNTPEILAELGLSYLESSARVMSLGLHPLITGVPFRHKYLVKALEYVLSHDGVWATTSDEIAEWYLKIQAVVEPLSGIGALSRSEANRTRQE